MSNSSDEKLRIIRSYNRWRKISARVSCDITSSTKRFLRKRKREVSTNFPDRSADFPRNRRPWCVVDARRRAQNTRYATRNYRETQKRMPSRRRRRNRARTQGHRILICPRFALLIRQRCMLMRLTPCMRGVCIILSDVGRSTYRGGDRETECRLRKGEPSPLPLLSPIRIPRVYIQRDLPLDAIQIERIVGSRC